MLKANRLVVCQWLAAAKIEEWMEDGEAEIERGLTGWLMQGVDLGDDDALVGLAESNFEEAAG
jgi:hypothetical protein